MNPQEKLIAELRAEVEKQKEALEFADVELCRLNGGKPSQLVTEIIELRAEVESLKSQSSGTLLQQFTHKNKQFIEAMQTITSQALEVVRMREALESFVSCLKKPQSAGFNRLFPALLPCIENALSTPSPSSEVLEEVREAIEAVCKSPVRLNDGVMCKLDKALTKLNKLMGRE